MIHHNSDEEVRDLQRAVAAGDALAARRLVRAYERSGLLPREREVRTVWAVTHFRHRGGRAYPEAGHIIDHMLIGVYPTEASAYLAAVDRAIEGSWKLRNRADRREFDRAVIEDDLPGIIHTYNAGSDYSIEVAKRTIGATRLLRSGFDRGNWSL